MQSLWPRPAAGDRQQGHLASPPLDRGRVGRHSTSPTKGGSQSLLSRRQRGVVRAMPPTHQGRGQGVSCPHCPPRHYEGPAGQRAGWSSQLPGRETRWGAGEGGSGLCPCSTGHVEVPREESCLPHSPTPNCHFLGRSHLQPPTYGPVLNPMNKVHGGVNKLPSVNQLVGQPPPHSSAAGPSLGPMGEWLGRKAQRAGLASDTSGNLRAGKQTGDGCLPSAALSTGRRHRPGWSHPFPMPG